MLLPDSKKFGRFARMFGKGSASDKASSASEGGDAAQDTKLDTDAGKLENAEPDRSEQQTESQAPDAGKPENSASDSNLAAETELPADDLEEPGKLDPVTESVLRPLSEIEDDYKRGVSSFEMFVDERILVSHDAFGKKEMKIKVLEVSDEPSPSRWKFGDRVKLDKILITIKHLESDKIEEGELDIAAVEKELAEKRHYTSTNRWVPVSDIKNGYVIGSRHTSLISDALALDYIVF